VRRLFGPRHPDVGFLLSNLGNTASKRGRLAEAEAYQREALSIVADWYGEDHVNTAAVGATLAQTFVRMKRYDEAIALYRQAIAVFARSPDGGPNSPLVAIGRSNLGVALSRSGDHAGAIREYQLALGAMRRLNGDGDRTVVVVTGNLAMEIASAGHPDSAEVLLRKEIPVAQRKFGDRSDVLGDLEVKLSQLLVKQRRFAEALVMATAGVHILDAMLGPRSSSTIAGRNVMIAVYAATGDTVNAARVRAAIADSLKAATRSGR
jgi:eukaryotic-like serine/threonine-protein kinase